MAGFLYFVNGDERPPTPEKIRQWGLAYAFTRSPEHRAINSNSPSKKPGSIIADPDRMPGKVAGYHPDQQTWRKLPKVEGRPEIWVGYWNDAKPGPGDLERSPMLPGETAIKLGDGRHWTVPTLAEFDGDTKDGECVLPAPLDYDEDGNLFAGKPVGQYAELWELVHPVALGLCFDEHPAPSERDVQKAAFALITTNYVVSMPELVALGALQNDTMFNTVVIASCRGQWLMEAISELSKKNEPQLAADGSDTSAGKAA